MLLGDHELRSLVASELENLKRHYVDGSQRVAALLSEKATDCHPAAQNRRVRRPFLVTE